MRKAEVLTALGFIAFSLAVIVQALQVGAGWAEGQPQSGFFPFWLGLLVSLCGLIVLGQHAFAAKDSVAAFFHDRTAFMSIVKVSVTGTAMLIFTYLIGFYAAAIVYIFVYTRFVGKHKWPAVILMTVLIPYGSFFLFERALSILLPRGIYSLPLPFLD